MHTSTDSTLFASPALPTYLPRIDIYGAVHKGLRWALSAQLTRMGAVSPADRRGMQRACDELDGVLYLFVCHAGHEDRHLHAAIEARRPGAAAAFGGAHAAQEHAVAELRAIAGALASAAPSDAPALWRALYLRFAAFAGENFAHMSEEEEVAQPLLEALYSPAELQRIHAGLLADVAPDDMRRFLCVMIASGGRDERVSTLRRVRPSMPAEAFASLLAALRKSLGDADFAEVIARLAA